MSVLPFNNPGKRIVTAPTGAPQQITKTFPIQSYFFSDIPGGYSALLPQPTNTGIVQSTLQERNQTEAYAVGLAPWSEAPVAIEMQVGEAGGLSSPIILRPGEVLAPAGLARGEDFRTFRGLRWGLPFGWLGGGLVSLFLFKSPDSLPNWTFGPKEVLFHRFQIKVREASATPPSPMVHNWPTRFPWTRAYAGADGVNQSGTPNVSVSPTKTLLRLNDAALDTAAPFRVIFWQTDTFENNAEISPTDLRATAYWESAFPSNIDGGWPANQQLVAIPQEFNAIAANSWGITIEAPAGSPLLGKEVNIARFGLI